ncbi:unnamed protein product [Phaeothamnion confervicola]
MGMNIVASKIPHNKSSLPPNCSPLYCLRKRLRRRVQSMTGASADRWQRAPRWLYLGPIVAAPSAHIAVSIYRHAKSPQMRALILWGGIVGSTVGGIATRLWLMRDAGYPGAESVDSHKLVRPVVAASDAETAKTG